MVLIYAVKIFKRHTLGIYNGLPCSQTESILRACARGEIPGDVPPRRGHERRRDPCFCGDGLRPAFSGKGGLAVIFAHVPAAGAGGVAAGDAAIVLAGGTVDDAGRMPGM